MFPVQRLYPNITSDFKKYSSIFISDAIAKGLRNEITIVDQESSTSTYARIVAYQNDSGNYEDYEVILSAAFSQYVWIICDVLLRSADYFTMIETSNQFGGVEYLIEDNKRHLAMTDQEILEKYPDFISLSNIRQFKDQCRRANLLLKNTNLIKDFEDELHLAQRLISSGNISWINVDDYAHLDMNHEGYGGVVNSLCVKAHTFILLHELNHCLLNHFNDNVHPQKEKEKEADEHAFKKMYDSAPTEEKFTVGCALLAQMITTLFLSPNLKRVDSHPRADERLINVYNYIKGDNPKYTYMLVYGFNLWSKIAKKSDSPAPLNITDPKFLDSIVAYFTNI